MQPVSISSISGNPGVFQNVIFLSDGQCSSLDNVMSVAENFHRNGIRLTSVALGSNVNTQVMRRITGIDRNPPLPYRSFYFEQSDAANMASTAIEMRREILECSYRNRQ